MTHAAARRVVIGFGDAADLPEDDDLPTESMPLNMGPSHPAMHGTVRMVLEVEGEKIRSADMQIGYLHRCFEKEAENATWTQIFPYTDRLNYVSPMLNNVGYALAVEKLLDIDKQDPRARAVHPRDRRRDLAHHRSPDLPGGQRDGTGRVHRLLLPDEGARMAVGASRRSLGRAPDPQLCAHRRRGRGPDRRLVPPSCATSCAAVAPRIADADKMLTSNRIFRDRMDGIGIITRDDAVGWGLTGPVGRSTGLAYDVRKDHPYLVYDRFDFDVPVGSKGDNFDRYAVRLEEMLQSMRILEQAMDHDARRPGAHRRRARRVAAQARGLQHHRIHDRALQADHGRHLVPPGEIYSFTEGGNGELGFYIVSNGDGQPWKCRVRPPCFANLAVLNKVLPGLFIADVVPTFGMINMIGGECDR